MSNAQSFVAIGVSLFLGGSVGLWAGRSAGFAPGERIGSSAGPGKEGPATGLEREGLQNISEDTGLEGLSFQKQKEVLLGLQAKFEGLVPSHLELALTRMVRGISADQAAELLEALSSGLKGKIFMRRALSEHLASLDARRAVELGQKLKDNGIIGRTLNVVARKSGPEALGLLETLSKEERATAVNYLGNWILSPSAFHGSVNDLAKMLRTNEAILKEWTPGNTGGIGALLGTVAGQGNGDPRTGFAELQALALELQSKGNPGLSEADLKKRVDWVLKDVAAAMYVAVLKKSPEAASEFSERLPDSQRGSWSVSLEVQSRLERQGINAAVEFAEKLDNVHELKFAAATTWMAFARKDRAAALDWLDALPKGDFRDGVMESVMWDSRGYVSDSASRADTWSSSVAGASALRSGTLQLDYFAQVLKDSMTGFGSRTGWVDKLGTPAELIPELPLSEAGKTELYRRFAPIKP